MLAHDGVAGRISVILPAPEDREAAPAAYVAAKAGVEALVKALAREWSGRINVNAIAVATRGADDASVAADAASTALWLASPAAEALSGKVIHVDATQPAR
jgi:NAD(P)-dependent dehydrogenase (short-subunit alcohol dehydrogenase family)